MDDEPLAAHAYLIATGSEPSRPPLPGLDEVDWLSSTTAMEQTELPESLVVIGGGYVGMEQAQLFAHLGAQVTLVGRLAPTAEPELADTLRRVFADDSITVIEDRAVQVDVGTGEATVVTGGRQRASGARLLVATGRTPRTNGLGLDAAGVQTDERGFVAVDEAQRSSNPRVFAAGDVSGAPQYVYVAAATGRVAALNATDAAGPRPAIVDYTGLPAVVFTRPQLASAGLSETQALAAGYRCDCRVLPLEYVPRTLVNRDTRGFIKMVANADTGEILGLTAVAKDAGELAAAGVHIIGKTIAEVADAWAPYLTMTEGIRIVAKAFTTDVSKLSCCA